LETTVEVMFATDAGTTLAADGGTTFGTLGTSIGVGAEGSSGVWGAGGVCTAEAGGTGGVCTTVGA
jgi:hypothetical protein